MKKLLALLLMALLLIPALATALEMPNIPTSINVNTVLADIASLSGSTTVSPHYSVEMSSKTQNRTLTTINFTNTPSGAIIASNQYIATYYLSGMIQSFTYSYPYEDGYCEAKYTLDGTALSAIVKGADGRTKYTYSPESGWIDIVKDDEVDPVCDLNDRKPFPLPNGFGNAAKQGTRPEDLLVVLSKAGYSFNSMDELLSLSQNFRTSDVIYTDSDKKFINVAYYEDDIDLPVYAYYKNNQLIEWYVGPAAFHPNDNQIWVIGLDTYGINTSGRYYWNGADAGKLMEYTIYTSDRSMVAGYSGKNVLQTYELWDSEKSYWKFKNNEWSCSTDGIPRHAEPAEPDAYILEKILHAPEPATYTSKCVTSTANFDSEGVPYIIANMNATPTITATQLKNDLRATEFEITLKDGDETVQPDAPVTLTLAYPAGMTQSIVENGNYEMVVVHNNNEVMSTISGNVQLTKDGPQVTATSFSPYTVVWGTADELRAKYPGSIVSNTSSLPQTGDTSNLALYAVLLTLCVGGLAVLLVASKRRTQR